MAVTIAPSFTIRAVFWTAWKALLTLKGGVHQYEADDSVYTIWFYDGAEAYVCTIWQGQVPDGVVAGGYTQVQNDADKADFTANYQATANLSIAAEGTFRDPKMIRRFGNLAALSTAEVLVSSRAYVEQNSQAQRSLVSTSAQDAPAGSGAKKVRITYLNSAYELKTEDVTLNGTSAVNTVATDIRFIEKFQVIQGAAAAGAVKLMTTTGGGGSEFCGLGVGTFDAFLCHHYVPAGRSGYVYGWSASMSDECKFKLMGRAIYGGNTVDEHWDLVDVLGQSAGTYNEFSKKLVGVPYGEKTYLRITVVPNQSTARTIRSDLLLWEK